MLRELGDRSRFSGIGKLSTELRTTRNDALSLYDSETSSRGRYSIWPAHDLYRHVGYYHRRETHSSTDTRTVLRRTVREPVPFLEVLREGRGQFVSIRRWEVGVLAARTVDRLATATDGRAMRLLSLTRVDSTRSNQDGRRLPGEATAS